MQDFATDEDRIIYVLSYLRGNAMTWFEPQIFNTDPNSVPYWAGNFQLFASELATTFGPHDPVGDAEAQLRELRMKPSDRIATFLVSFNHLAAQINWGPDAIRSQLYEVLPRRIKDAMIFIDYPETLPGVKVAAVRVDDRYWKREAERAREQARSGGASGSSRHSAPHALRFLQKNLAHAWGANAKTLANPNGEV
jgi:hypothetical protein